MVLGSARWQNNKNVLMSDVCFSYFDRNWGEIVGVLCFVN